MREMELRRLTFTQSTSHDEVKSFAGRKSSGVHIHKNLVNPLFQSALSGETEFVVDLSKEGLPLLGR